MTYYLRVCMLYERLLVEDGLMLRYRDKGDFGDERVLTHANRAGLFSGDQHTLP